MDIDIFSTTPKNPDPEAGKAPAVPHVVRTFSKDAAQAQEKSEGDAATPVASVAASPQPPPQTATVPPSEPAPPPAPAIVEPTSTLHESPIPPITPAPQATPLPIAPSKNEILERLHTKAEAFKKGEVPVHATDSILFSAEGKNALPVPTVEPKKETAHEATSTPPPVSTGPSPLHTYQLDFADRVRNKKASPFSILAEEQDSRKAVEVAHSDSRRRTVWYVAGMVLVLFGIGGGYAAYHFVSGTPMLSFGKVPSLIFADDQKKIEGDAAALRNALAQTDDAKLAMGAVRVFYTLTSTTTPEGTVTSIVSGNKLFAALQLPAPSILTRNVEPESTIGLINTDNETRAFFILRVSSYESTFRGMLDWEKTLGKDLSLFYPPYPAPPPVPVSTTMSTSTTATTTAQVPAPPPNEVARSFADGTVANTDVRILYDAARRVIMLYGYRDKKTLIIAGNTAAFTEIVHRLAATRQ